jgi:hypothetical protein
MLKFSSGDNVKWGFLEAKEGMRTGKLFAIDRLATGSIATREVTTLEHEIGDDAVEVTASVSKSVLASAKFTEVLCSLRDYIVVQFEDNSALGLSVDRNVELNARG